MLAESRSNADLHLDSEDKIIAKAKERIKMIDQSDECGLEQCHCIPQAETGFCSDSCQQASHRNEVVAGCDCGHVGCTIDVSEHPPGQWD